MSPLATEDELRLENVRLQAEIARSDASPFLGQQRLGRRVEQRLHAEFIKHPSGEVAGLLAMLRLYPAVGVCFLASLARRQTDGRFYSPLAEALGVDDVSYNERIELWTAFRKAAIGLGLPIPSHSELGVAGVNRYRLEYFVQAGPLHGDLRALAEAFVAVRDSVGDVDLHDPSACRALLDAVLEELGDRARTLQRVLANDRAAWHAAAMLRLQSGATPRNDFETALQAAIVTAAAAVPASRSRRPPPLRLVFSEGGIALRAPAMAGWTWRVDGPWGFPALLGPDQELPLGAAETVTWSAMPMTPLPGVPLARTVPVWRNAHALVFDRATGALLASVAATPATVGADACTIVARTAFRGTARRGEMVSEETFEGLHVADLDLADGPVSFSTGSGVAVVELFQRPSLAWADGPPVFLEGRPVFGADTISLRLNLPDDHAGWAGRVEAVVSTGRRDHPVRALFVKGDDGLVATLPLPAIDRFDRLAAFAAFAGEDRPLLHAPAAWIWPGLAQFEVGCFVGPVPGNFDPDGSRNAVVGDRGVVVGAGEGRLSELAFRIAESRVRLRVETGEVEVQLVERGVVRPLPRGAVILDDGGPKQLRIWCADRTASLDVCGIVERNPFKVGGRRSVALAGLTARGGSRQVEIWPGGDQRRAYDLVCISRPAEPSHVDMRLIGDEPRGVLGLAAGARLVGRAVRLGLGPETRLRLEAGNGLDAGAGAAPATIRIQPRALPDGLWLVELFEVEAQAAERPLRSARGDRFGLLVGILQGSAVPPKFIVADLAENPAGQRALFRDVNAALMTPWVRDCWEGSGLKSLDTIWRQLGLALRQADGGRNVLLAALGACPPADTNPSWLPMRHPIDLDPGLYSGDLDQLADALADVDSADAREFAHWLNPSTGSSERQREACLRFVDRLATATAGSPEGDANAEHTQNASRLLHKAPADYARLERDRAMLGDIAENNAIVERAPNFFAGFAHAARTNSVATFLTTLDRLAGGGAARDAGYLLRLGPELLALSLRDADRALKDAR